MFKSIFFPISLIVTWTYCFHDKRYIRIAGKPEQASVDFLEKLPFLVLTAQMELLQCQTLTATWQNKITNKSRKLSNKYFWIHREENKLKIMKAQSYLNLIRNYHNQISQEQLFLKKEKCAEVYNFPINLDVLAV